MSVYSQDGNVLPFWVIPTKAPQNMATAIEHNCPEIRGNNPNHSLFSVTQKKQESLPSEWLVSKLNEKHKLQNSESTRKYWGFWGHVRKESVQTTSRCEVLHGEVSEHAIPIFCCWRIYETLRAQGPYCSVTTFCVINWLQISAQGAKITSRKQVIK